MSWHVGYAYAFNLFSSLQWIERLFLLFFGAEGLFFSFAATFSEKVTRTVRKFSPHLAAKMRPPHMLVDAQLLFYVCFLIG